MSSGPSLGRRPTPSTRTFAAETATINAARAFVTTTLEEYAAGTTLLQNAELVASELAANAVEAAGGETYTVSVARDRRGAAVITVANPTTGDPLPTRGDWNARIALAPIGRGLGIVERLAEEVSVDERSGAITIRARLEWDPS